MDADTVTAAAPRTPPKRENLLINLIFNIVVPSLIVTSLSETARP